LLVQEGRPATVRLHPDDMNVLGLSFGPAVVSGSVSVQWVADAMIESGGCLVECAGTVIDATLPKRWERAIAALGLHQPWQQEPSPEVKEKSAPLPSLNAALEPVEQAPAKLAQTITNPAQTQVAMAEALGDGSAAAHFGANDFSEMSAQASVSSPLADPESDAVHPDAIAQAEPERTVETSVSQQAIDPLYIDEASPND
jgi:hypothetical protein